MENVNHPAHYGGAEDKFEVIKVLRAWDLELAKGFCWGNVIKYTARADKKGGVEDREKATWYADELESIEKELAARKEAAGPIPKSVVVSGDARIVIDWETRTYQMLNQPISEWRGYGGGGGGGSTWVSPSGAASATVKRCNSTYGCVHGYHGRGCPLWRDVP